MSTPAKLMLPPRPLLLGSKELAARIRAATTTTFRVEDTGEERTEAVVRKAATGLAHCRACGCRITKGQTAVGAYVWFSEAEALRGPRHTPSLRFWHDFDCLRPNTLVSLDLDDRTALWRDGDGVLELLRLGAPAAEMLYEDGGELRVTYVTHKSD